MLFAVQAALCGTVFAQAADTPRMDRTARIESDNDFFDFSLPPRDRPDFDYTQGLRLAWDFRGAPRFAKALVCRDDGGCRATLEIGQEMYTSVIGWVPPPPGDRPFAGWLYGKLQLDGGTAGERTSVALTLGVTGPASLAGAVQREFHHLIPGFYEPIGWEYQLPTEPAFALTGSRAWRVAPGGAPARHVDIIPSIGASMGTLRTGAAAGIRVRAGTSLAHPWLASDRPAFAPYAFAGVSGEAVIWDMFLDGTVFRDSWSTTHKPFVGQWEYGAGVWIHRFGLEYGAVTRTREFRAAPPRHTYGSFRVSWTLK